MCAAELEGLGIRTGPLATGGVPFTATTRQLYQANLWLRTATRVLLRLGTFEAHSFDALQREAAALPWDSHLRPDDEPVFRVSSTASDLFHTEAVAEHLATLLGGRGRLGTDTRPGQKPVPEMEVWPPSIVVRLVHNRVTISVDASGEPLYRRGWRQNLAKAPLRPTLAAAMLLAAGWDPTTPLVDPFCGSGTIPIEAALLGRGWAPGRGRDFAFQRWPNFEPGTWASVAGAARAAEQPADTTPTPPARILAGDRDAGAVAATRANATRAGVSDALIVRCAAVSDLGIDDNVGRPAPGPAGMLVTNPPYGERVGSGADLRGLYARLGQVAKTSFPGWGVALLVHDPALAGHTGLPLTELLRTSNGGIPVHLLSWSDR